MLGEQDPRKQGLKLVKIKTNMRAADLGEQDPRKQGLKHGGAYSGGWGRQRSESKIQENKDWNYEDMIREAPDPIYSESKIQENKDWNSPVDNPGS